MMRKRFAVFGVLALVLALLMPSRAFGWDLIGDGVWWRGNTSEGMYGACVHAGNKYDAAAWLFSPGDPAMLSTEVRTKLSDPNYGGRFYEYAQTFSFMEDLTQYPEWLPAYVGVANLFVNGFGVGIFDVGFYTSNVSESLYAGAKIDFQRVLAGEDLGGGGGSSGGTDVSGSFPSQFTLNTVFGVYANNDNWSGFVTPSGIQYYKFTNPSAMGSYLSSRGLSHFYVFNAPYHRRTGNGKSFSPNQLLYASASPINFQIVADSGSIPYLTFNASSDSAIWFVQYRSEGFSSFTPNLSGTATNYNGSFSFSNVGTSHSFVGTRKNGSNMEYITYCNSNGVGAYVPPSGDWPEPDTPVTPDPPEVPTPTAPTVTPDPEPTQPTPTWPDITINIPGAPTVEVTPTGLDYTELLTRINDNLNTINSYTVSINSGLNSLRSDLVTEFESVEQGLRNIYQFLQHMDSMLERHCQHLRDALSDCTHHLELYMKELFEWLPQQLNYDAEFSYDDSAVTSLLRAILNKIPGGSSGIPDTFKPNPQADEPGFFDWLTDLWHRFLIDLVSVLPDEIGGLVDAFSQLTHYFPFSIPWDLAAMLALFEHEPVTPVFDVPWGFGGNEGDVEMICVDLSPWDGVMQMVRPVFVVGFCWQLALITKDLLAGFDLNKGGV